MAYNYSYSTKANAQRAEAKFSKAHFKTKINKSGDKYILTVTKKRGK